MQSPLPERASRHSYLEYARVAHRLRGVAFAACLLALVRRLLRRWDRACRAAAGRAPALRPGDCVRVRR